MSVDGNITDKRVNESHRGNVLDPGEDAQLCEGLRSVNESQENVRTALSCPFLSAIIAQPLVSIQINIYNDISVPR